MPSENCAREELRRKRMKLLRRAYHRKKEELARKQVEELARILAREAVNLGLEAEELRPKSCFRRGPPGPPKRVRFRTVGEAQVRGSRRHRCPSRLGRQLGASVMASKCAARGNAAVGAAHPKCPICKTPFPSHQSWCPDRPQCGGRNRKGMKARRRSRRGGKRRKSRRRRKLKKSTRKYR